MSEMIGMDVEAVRRTASELRRKADEIRAVEARVDAIVGQINGSWQGNRARRFVGDWHGHHRAALLLLADRVDGLGQSALNNAGEQEAASGGGRAGGGGHPGGQRGPNLWDSTVGGFLSGAWSDVKETAGGVGDLVSMAWDGEKRKAFVDGMGYAFSHPGEALSAIGGEMLALDDWKHGRYAQALGHMTVEVAGLVVAPLKLTKLAKLHKLEEAGEAASRARITEHAAKDSLKAVQQRAADHPRWRTGEVPWYSSGGAPGRWADPDEFRVGVVNPARASAHEAEQRALAREHDVSQAQRSYDRWSNAAHRGEDAEWVYRRLEDAGDVNDLSDEMNRRASPNSGGGGGW